MKVPKDLLAIFIAFYLLMIPAIHFGDMNERFEVSQFELFLSISVFIYFPLLLFILAIGRMQD